MLRSAAIFLAIALIAALVGYSGISAAAEPVARSIFPPFAVIAAVGFLIGLAVRR